MDEIQRKLELIDKQLAGGNFHRQIISASPLLFAAIGLIAGILLQNTFELLVSIWLILLALLTVTTIFFFIIQRSSTNYQSPITNYQYATAYLSLGCFVCLGAIRLNRFYQPALNDIRNFVVDERKLATIRGLVVTDPHINRNRQWKFAKFTYTDPSSSFYLTVDEVKTVDGWAKVTGTVRVQVDEPVLDLKAGDYVETCCWLDKLKKATNPGQFNVTGYLARKNVFIAALVKSHDGIRLLKSHRGGIFTKLKGKLRKTTTQALLGSPLPETPSEGLLQALLLGYRGHIDSETYEAFRKTGLLHFISLSGMHLGILIGIIWWLCKTAGLMKRTRAIICIIAIGLFLLIVPPRAPTLRAAIIGWAFCVSFFLRRRSNSLNTLSLAAIILLLMRPTQLFEAGWQLSFASVLGILVFTDRIHFFLYEKITSTSWFKQTPRSKLLFRIIAKPGPYILRLFSVGFAAWLGGAGILLYHFYIITPLASVWTAIVFPFVALILALGYLKIILSFLLPTVALGLAVIVTKLADSLIWIVKHIAWLDVSQILIGHVPLTPAILYYCIIAFAAFAYFRRPLLKKVLCAVTVLSLIGFLGVTKWQRINRDSLVLTCLDVGHGQAILAQLPGKVNVLFDAGSLDKSDVGTRIVAPFLDYSGLSKIDAIIASHDDIDHINGIPEIVAHCDVNNVYANDAFSRKADQWGTAKFLEERLNEKSLEIKNLKNLNVTGAAKVKILWPNEQICAVGELSDNDKSLVILIEFAGRKVLLCSDIEKFAQQELLRLFPNLEADIVVVPHHGLAKTLDPDFLESLDADILMCSCGRSDYKNNRIIKPKSKAKWLCTAKHGAFVVCVDKQGMIK